MGSGDGKRLALSGPMQTQARELPLAMVRQLSAKLDELSPSEEWLLACCLGMDTPITNEAERLAVVAEIERLDALGKLSDRLEALCALEIAYWRRLQQLPV